MTDDDDIDRRFRELMAAEFGDLDADRNPRRSDTGVNRRRHPSAPRPADGGEPHGQPRRPQSFLDDAAAGFEQVRGNPQRSQRRADDHPRSGSLAADFEALGLDDESIKDADAQLRSQDFHDLSFDAFPAKSKSGDYWFSMSEALDEVELDPLDPTERWRPPTPDYRPSRRGWLALITMGLAILVAILTMTGVLGQDFGILAGLLFGTSLAIALSLIPWRRDDFTDGAKL